MEIRIDGKRLDFSGDFKYKKNNQIFGFDALTADRTVSIKIPRTRRNAQILAHGERAEADGSEVRVIHAAEVYDGAIRHVGRLYITKADESGYTAVFCFGAVEALRSINGKMSDLTADRLSQATDTPIDADIDGTAEPFRAIRYQQDDVSAKYLPSFSVTALLREAASGVGVALSIPPSVEQLRVLPPKAAGMKEKTIAFASTATPSVVIGVDADPSAPGNIPEQVLALLPVAGTAVMVTTEMVVMDSVGTNITHHEVRTEVRGWTALQPCTLTFPFDFPEEMYLIEPHIDGSVTFLGGWSFEKVMTMDESEESATPTWTGGQAPTEYGGIDGITIRTSDRVSSVSGEPLAGRSVNIDAGQTFLIVTPSAFLSADSEVPAPAGYSDDWRCSISGWVFGGDGLTYDEQVTVKGADEVLDGQVALHDQLSDDDTLVAWLQDIAAITGTILRYDEANGLWFDVADMDGWSSVDLKRLAGWKDTERKMLDFGQVAEVKFHDDKNSSGSQAVEYQTFNDTLSERTTVRELLYSNGSAGLPAAAMLVRNGDSRQDVGIYCLTNPNGGGGTDMSRVSLTPNSTIRRLASISTRQVRTAMMSAVEVEAVKPDTLLVSGGQRWTWTEANVSGSSVQWTLQKVGGSSVTPPMEVFAVQSYSESEPNYNVAVMRICYAAGLSSLPDRMTMAEAAAVTEAQIVAGTYGSIFSPVYEAEASNILSFNEFQYFSGIAGVQNYAFNAVGATTQMASITLPSSVTEIRGSAFAGCHSLTALILNEGLTSFSGVGSITAANCPKTLTDLTLPSTVTSLGSRALQNAKLVTLTCLATTPPAATAYSLNPMPALTRIKVPAASVDDYKTAAGWSQYSAIISAI